VIGFSEIHTAEFWLKLNTLNFNNFILMFRHP
jgi:hypothetical protein